MVTGFTVPSRVICRVNIIQLCRRVDGAACHRFSTRLWSMRTMKKAKPSDRPPKDIDEYLAGVPEPARTTLNKVRAVIRAAVPPEATEAISYRMPTFKYKGSLVAFAAFKNHCSFFPMS